MVSVIMTRVPPNGGGRWASRKSAVRDLFIFLLFPFSVRAFPISPMDLKRSVVTQHERCSGSQFKAPQDPTPESDDGWKQEEVPKPVFFLQKKSKLHLLLLSQLQRALKSGLLSDVW